MPVRDRGLWHHFDSLDHQADSNLLGMWVFLATELLVFGALFTGYSAYRWRYPAGFEAGSRHLNLLIGGVNTVVLLTSSLTMALAVRAASQGRQALLVRLLLATLFLGSAFLGLKAVEYRQDYLERLVPGLAFDRGAWQELHVNPNHVQLFLIFYYVMTGIHALHLTIGIGVLGILTLKASRGHFTPQYSAPVEMWGLYWHFVDIIWLFLLPLLYLVSTRTSFY